MTITMLPKQIVPRVLFSLAVAVGSAPCLAGPQSNASEDVPDWIRGEGEQLELRLTGHVTRRDSGSVDGAEVRVDIDYNGHVFESWHLQVEDGRFQVWLPVNKYAWYRITVNVTCPDGARCTRTILRHQLRELVRNGLRLNVRLPTRQVTVRVEQNGEGVAGAQVRAELSGGATLRSETDADGVVVFRMFDREQLTSLTAWSDRGLIGGYQFSRKPARDPRADTHVIAMYRCRPFEIHFSDADGQPIEGVQFHCEVATPAPEHNFLGMPDDSTQTTSQDGIATLSWFPDIEDAHCSVDITSGGWVIESIERSPDRLRITAKRAVERKKLTGHISGNGRFAGGFNVRLGSFQAERESGIDYVYSFSDASGRFSAEVLPDTTYAVFLEDEKWVTDAMDLIPFDSRTGKQESVELVLSEGIPVRITLTQGNDRRPIPGAWFNIDSLHEFTWVEDGEVRSGVLARSVSTWTNAQGVIETVAPEGLLETTVYLHDWSAVQTVHVKRGHEHVISFHRKVDEPVEVIGRILPWNEGQQQVAGAMVHIRAIDGESSEEFRIRADEEGTFRIKTRATKLGAIAYSADRQFAGSLVIRDFSESAHIQMYPTRSCTGQLTDQEGNPIAGHRIWASIQVTDEERYGTAEPTVFRLPRIETHTDSEGKYRFTGLPCRTRIWLWADTLPDAPYDMEYVGRIFFLPDDGPRSWVTKIGPAPERPKQRTPLPQRYASMHRDCRLGSYHLMAIVYDGSDDPSREFIDSHLLDSSSHQTVAGFMQLLVDVTELSVEDNRAFVERVDWHHVPQRVLAVAYDLAGEELGRVQLDPQDADAAKAAYEFIELHAPPRHDAEVKWKQAFRQAKEQNKRVWVRTSQRYCGPCFMLSRWIDDHREVLEKDFILLKIDDVRDVNGRAIAERLKKGRRVGVPFHAMFDANEQLLADSYGPLGNIGMMSGLEGKRHFKKMLDAACSRITPQDMDMLLESLED